MEPSTDDRKKELYRIGISIFILLLFLTFGEYFIGANAGVWWAPLIGIAILKAFFVMRDYMHIGRLFQNEQEDIQ